MEEGHDVEGAWEFFNKEMFWGKGLDDKISHASERALKGSERGSQKQVNIEL